MVVVVLLLFCCFVVLLMLVSRGCFFVVLLLFCCFVVLLMLMLLFLVVSRGNSHFDVNRDFGVLVPIPEKQRN